MRTFVRVAGALFIVFGLSSAAAGQSHPSFSVTVTGRGPAIVLIPGLLSTGEVWSSTVERYQEQYSLHTVTLAGFGGPPPIGSPFLSRVRDELIAYMRDQKMQKPIVIGHSLAGFLAFWIAATAPDLVGGVIAVDGVPYLPALGNPAATPETTAAMAKQVQTIYASLSQEQLIAQSRMAMTTMMTAPALLIGALGSAPEPMRPTLENAYRAQVAQLPASTVKMAATRHFIMLDDPSFLFAAIDEFLASLPKR